MINARPPLVNEIWASGMEAQFEINSAMAPNGLHRVLYSPRFATGVRKNGGIMGGSVRSFKAFKCCGLSIKAVQFLGRAYRWHVVTGILSWFYFEIWGNFLFYFIFFSFFLWRGLYSLRKKKFDSFSRRNCLRIANNVVSREIGGKEIYFPFNWHILLL